MPVIRRHDPAVSTHVSWSQLQLAQRCGLQLRYRRQGEPEGGPLSAAAILGRAVGVGCQFQAVYGKGVDAAAAIARRSLRDEVDSLQKPGQRGIRWDDPPRVTKKGEVYESDRGRIPDLSSAERLTDRLVRAWISAFPDLRALPEGVEREFQIKLRNPEGWTITCVPDLISIGDEIIDFKTAGEHWTETQLAEKRGQGLLYQAAFSQAFGKPPERFSFHVLSRRTGEVQVLEVPFDPVAINTFLNFIVRPAIRTIQSEAFVANPSGWWCSAKWCPWYETVCPIGRVTHPEPAPTKQEAAA